MLDDLRDKPTRDVGNDGILILLVGKPNGAECRRFESTTRGATEKDQSRILY